MCQRNYDPRVSEGPFGPVPRPIPRLAWAVPVDISELGPSIEAYSKLRKEVLTLRLCHRFRLESLVSKLPREILENIVDELLHSERHKLQKEWKQAFACFQGRCRPEQHYRPYCAHTEDLFQLLITDISDDEFDPSDFDEEDKVKYVEGFLMESPEAWAAESRYEMHGTIVDKWLERSCLCTDQGFRSENSQQNFNFFNQVLRSHFGLEAIIFHEVLSYTMTEFLPDAQYMDLEFEDVQYTICLLVPASQPPSKAVAGNKKTAYAHQQFADPNDDISFRQTVMPSSVVLSKKQQLQFARAMRILDLRPHFHLTDMEKVMTPAIKDGDLLGICACSRKICPCDKKVNLDEKILRLGQYLTNKNSELACQSWPQLKMFAPSQAFSPNGHPLW